MSDLIQQVWVVPLNLEDMAPLPALLRNSADVALYDRKKKCFSDFYKPFYDPAYDTFEQCRAAMIEARTEALHEMRKFSRRLAASIEHIKTIPTAPFPDNTDVIREVSKAQQQESKEQEEAKAKEVRPALKRPSRRNDVKD